MVVKDDNCDVTFRAIIKSQNAGAIIGHRGANIERIRSEYNVTCNVPDSGSTERILIISGSLTKVSEALTDVIPSLEDRHPESNSGPEVRMLVLGSYVGTLIGTGGSKIKALRESTGAAIRVFEDYCPNSSERVFKIAGSPDIIVDAVTQILRVISQTRSPATAELYDPNNAPQLDEKSGAFPYPSRGRSGRNTRGGRGRGSRQHTEEDDNDEGGKEPSTSNSGDTYAQDSKNEDNSRYPIVNERKTVQYSVRNEDAGSIIGSGGSNIKGIRDCSSCSIIIDEPRSSTNLRTITITGSEEQIKCAKFLLQQSVLCDRQARENRGRSGRGNKTSTRGW